MIELSIYLTGYIVAYFICKRIAKEDQNGIYQRKHKALCLFVAIFSWLLVGAVILALLMMWVLKFAVYIAEKEWWNETPKW